MIETLEDWNERMQCSGCCQMPVCPQPIMLAQRKSATVAACGVLMVMPTTPPSCYPTPPLADYKKWYKTREDFEEQTQRNSSGEIIPDADPPYPITRSTTYTYFYDENGNCDADLTYGGTGGIFFSGSYPITGCTYSAGVFQSNYDSTGGGTGAGFEGFDRRSYLDGMTEAETITDINGAIDIKFAALAWPALGTGSHAATTSWAYTAIGSVYPGETIISQITRRKSRVRFRIPNSHLGDYFKITYDIAEFPTDPLVADSFFSEDNVVEWTGPGDQGAPTGETWLSPIIEIDPPDVPGERRIVNIRYSCYSGALYGVVPQVMGEAFTPPE